MCRRKLNRILLVIAWLLLVCGSYAQVSPVDNFEDLLPDAVLSGTGGDVCPSLLGTPSTSTFKVKTNDLDAGDSDSYEFEWVVYGGTILNTGFSGTIVNAITTTPQGGGINFSYVRLRGVGGVTNDSSFVTIQWDEVNDFESFVAVRQFSQWSCSDSIWSVYNQQVVNAPPVFTSFPPDIVIPYDSRNSFSLPVPGVDYQDDCYTGLQSLSYEVQNPEGNGIGLGVDSDVEVNLLTGSNLIIWTIDDGYHTEIDTQVIVVDQPLAIEHIAWVNPQCSGSNDGALYVTHVSDYEYAGDIEYQINGGAFSTTSYFTGLEADADGDTIIARLQYSVDTNGDATDDLNYTQTSIPYIISLRSLEASVSLGVPAEGEPGATVTPTTCATTNYGEVYIDTAYINATGRSLSFNGSSSYLALNKGFDAGQSEFSVAAWIKVPDVALADNKVIVSFNSLQAFELRVGRSSGTGVSYIEFETVTDGVSDARLTHDAQINDGKWHLVVASYNGGMRTIFVDGKSVSAGAAGGGTAGSGSGNFGFIGAAAPQISDFGGTPTGNFFQGQMAEVAMYSSAITESTVIDMMKNGMMEGSPTDRWILNDISSEISSQPTVFSSFGNTESPNHWARYYNLSLVSPDAPLLYQWDAPANAFPGTQITLLGTGAYTLTVNNHLGCNNPSTDEQSYVIDNSDDEPPVFLVNAALNQPSDQSSNGSNSCGTTEAAWAVDGNLANDFTGCSVSSTGTENEPWWEVDLQSSRNIKRVVVYHDNESSARPDSIYVLISASPITSLADTALSMYYFKSYKGTPPAVQEFSFNKVARYVRVYDKNNGVALRLAEVEVMIERSSYTRTFYLGDNECFRNITVDDGSVIPLAIDECGVIVSKTNNETNADNLNGFSLELGITYPVEWSATDDAGETNTYTIDYQVLDTINPIITNPHVGDAAFDTISWCDVDNTYSIGFPQATDNYNCPSGGEPDYNFSQLVLWIEPLGQEVQTWTDYEYDVATPEYDIHADYLTTGDHMFVWRLYDNSSNLATDTVWVHVQTTPKLSRLQTANISCYGANDGIIHMTRWTAEEGKGVQFVLQRESDSPIIQNNPRFEGLSPGSYSAWIEVDGCKSNNYGSSITLSQPPEIDPQYAVVPVACFGDLGDINLIQDGEKRLLHLRERTNTNIITGSGYADLNLEDSVTIEAMFFLDSLSADVNANANIFSYGNNYGLSLNGQDITFTVGGETLTYASVQQRKWYHVAGTVSSDGTARLFVDFNEEASASGVTFTAVAADINIGCDGTAAGNLQGFVRLARIWDNSLDATQLSDNTRFIDPVTYPNANLVANYPINIDGGSFLQNRTGYAQATLNTSDNTAYAWQAHSYFWRGTEVPYVFFGEDLVQVEAQTYNLEISAPYGCSDSDQFPLTMTDADAPTMTFFYEDGSDNASNIIKRVTSQTSIWGEPATPVNQSGDCWFAPFGGEFNPEIDDGDCPVSSVDTTWTILETGVTGRGTLDGMQFSDTTTVEWVVEDGAGNDRTVTITYIVRDDEKPNIGDDASFTVDNDTGECFYTVTSDTEFVPLVIDDNCTVIPENLINNYPGSYGSNLQGATLPVGDNIVRWIYRDKYNNRDTAFYTITVQDVQPPQVACNDFIVELNSSGFASIDSSDVDAGSGDNCSTLSQLLITRNIAYGKSVTLSSYNNGSCYADNAENANASIDSVLSADVADCTHSITNSEDNPSWQIDLGVEHSLYGVNVFASNAANLNNFWVLVSSTDTYTYSGDLDNPIWDDPSIYAEYYNAGNVSPNHLFTFNQVQQASSVKIIVNGTAQLALAEVEVYGTTDPANASHLTFDCNDVRYQPAEDTGEPGAWDDARGTFNPIQVLLSAIDSEGNIASCLSDVTVEDWILPEAIAASNVPVYVDNSGDVNLNDYVYDINNGSSDICGIDTMWIMPNTLLNCFNIGSYGVNLHVLDVNGNKSSTSTTVAISDTIPPRYTAWSDIELYLDPDGVYTIQPDDIFDNVWDNCTPDEELFYTFDPAVVQCADLINDGWIDLEVTITDGNGQTTTVNFDAEDPDLSARVQVVDNLPPVASLENFVLIIPEDGDSMISFQDIIPNPNLYDNCDGYGENIPVKQIKYNAGPAWCDAGNEGTDAANAFRNIAIEPGVVSNYGSSSSAYTSNVLDNLNDDSNSNIYISDSYSGTRQVYYYLNDTYEFNSSSIRWHIDDDLATTLIDVSTNNGAFNFNLSGWSEDPYGSYGFSNLNDGDFSNTTSGAYITDDDFEHDGNGGDRRSGQMYIDMGANSDISSIEVFWTGLINISGTDAYSPDRVILYYWNGSDWSEIDEQSLSLGNDNPESSEFNNINRDFRYLLLEFYEDSWRLGEHRFGIQEIIVNGIDNRENCALPSNNELFYSQDGGSSWTSAGSFDDNAPNIFYDITLGGIAANAFRIDMITSPDRRVGIGEWRLSGREISTANACTKYYCSDLVNSPVPVWLQWEDNSGNPDDVQVNIIVEPYFDIKEIQIKDCGYDGERYYPTLSGLSPLHDYYYTWDQIRDVANNGDRQTLFELSDGTINQDDKVPLYVFDNDAYEMPVVNQSWINLSTGATFRFPETADNGNYYEINLNMQDDNGCYDSYNYQFEYDGNSTTALSIKSWEACLGDTVRFEVLFPDPFTFWREDYMQYRWVNIDENLVDIHNGGGSRGGLRWVQDACNYYSWREIPQDGQNGDHFIEVVFDVSTVVNGGATTNIRYEFIGSQYTGTQPDQIHVGTGSYVSGNTFYITGELSPEGPYLIENEPTNGRTIPVGQRYIFGSCTFFNDYGACKEILEYQTTVHNVVTPEIQAFDAYNTVGGGWVDANTIQVCPRDTILYRVSNVDIGTYEYFEWNNFYIDEGDTIYTGRRLAQGNWYDDSILVVWDQYPENPRLTVAGFNALDCTSEEAVINHTFNDSEEPVLECADMDTIHANTPGTCGYTFTNLPPPPMSDNCRNRIESFRCEVDLDGNSTIDITGTNAAGTYPIGTTIVTWYASDYSGNEGTCSYTVTVLDTEPPSFGALPASSERQLLSNDGCSHRYSGTGLDMTATDYCSVPVTITATVYRDDNDDDIYDDVEQSGLSTLDNYPFSEGVSKVVWTATDDEDNLTYVSEGFDRYNTITTSYFVTVTDEQDPTFTNTFPDIPLNTDAGEAFATYAVPVPVNVDYTDDNCTAPADIDITFVSRSDGQSPTAVWPMGITVITWQAEDASGNTATQTQRVIVSDNEDPQLQTLADYWITACDVVGHQLTIPTVSDNVELKTLSYTIIDGGSYNHSETYTGEGNMQGSEGDYRTDPIPDLSPGTDYSITWSVEDTSGNSVTWLTPQNLRVHIMPEITLYDSRDLKCGGTSSGRITINGVITEPDYDTLYTVDTWQSAYTQTNDYIFDNLDGGLYGLQIQVEGCKSDIVEITVEEPNAYYLNGTITHPYCAEDSTGTIEPILTGGVAGQLLFDGSTSASVGHYLEINLTNTGMIEAWVYVTNQNSNGYIINKPGQYALRLVNGQLASEIDGTQLLSGFEPDVERWYHVAASWTSGIVSIYVNGSVEATQGQSTPAGDTNGLSIGSGFSGIIREVRVWSDSYTDVVSTLGGDPGSEKPVGAELGLVGLWSLDDGSGTSALNRTNSSYPANVSGISWTRAGANPQPQPGTYTWIGPDGYTNDSTSISGIPAGEYTLTFQDIYGCPESGLSQNFIVEAQDNTPPVISNMPSVELTTDPGICSHVITSAEEGSLYPTITNDDGHDCGYTELWSVYSEKEDATTTPSGSLVGQTLYEGINTIYLTVTQNGYSNHVEYDITLRDDENPQASAISVGSIVLNNDLEDGHITERASAYNSGSNDNCTPLPQLRYKISRDGGVTFTDSVTFNCNDLGESVELVLQAIDLSGNTDNATIGTYEVLDEDAPVFLIEDAVPQEMCANATDGTTGYVENLTGLGIERGIHYGDNNNCGDITVQYWVTNYADNSHSSTDWTTGADPSGFRFYEGTNEIKFRLTDEAMNRSEEKVLWIVDILEMPTPGAAGIQGD